MRALAFAVFVLLHTNTQVSATILSGNELLTSCEALLSGARHEEGGTITISPAGGECWTYLKAVQDLVVMTNANGERYLQVCAPPKSTLLQIVRIVTDYARSHPSELHQRAGQVAILALSNAFGCR